MMIEAAKAVAIDGELARRGVKLNASAVSWSARARHAAAAIASASTPKKEFGTAAAAHGAAT